MKIYFAQSEAYEHLLFCECKGNNLLHIHMLKFKFNTYSTKTPLSFDWILYYSQFLSIFTKFPLIPAHVQ